MSIKKQAYEIVDQLPDDATWEDLVNELYLQRKIVMGMTHSEQNKDVLDLTDVHSIRSRVASSKDIPDDMRNTQKYTPGNATTFGMVGGVIAILFSFVFPPIAWIAGIMAISGGILGLKNKEKKAWVPILMAIVSLIPILKIWMN